MDDLKITKLSSKAVLSGLLIGLALLASLPIFFEIYREAAFNTVPHDDYASFLQHLVGQGGSLPGSPYIYRILSVVVAIPFYFALPLYQFTNLGSMDLAYLKAIEALSMVSFISILLTALVIFQIARQKFNSSLQSALLVALTVPLLSYSISRPGIDPLAILWISILVYCFDRPRLFSGLILISAFLNEKIAFIFIVVTLCRWLWMRSVKKKAVSKGLSIELMASLLTLGIYFLTRTVLRFPGFENQTNLYQFVQQAVASLANLISLKGLVLNLVPTILIFLLVFLAIWSDRLAEESQFYKVDSICALALFVLGLGVDLQFTVGRIVMYAYPLYLPAISVLMDKLTTKTSFINEK